MRKVTALIALIMLPCQFFGWGSKGHHIVGDIAEAHLSPAAKAAVQSLLGADTLASISTWADEVRRDRPERTTGTSSTSQPIARVMTLRGTASLPPREIV